MRDNRLQLDGIVTVLNTPFNEKGEVDLAAVLANVHRAIEAEVAGFLVPAMASEVGKLTDREREEIVTAVLEENRGRTTVVGGASAGEQKQRIANLRRMVELGCDGVLVAVGYENKQQYRRTIEELAEELQRVATKSSGGGEPGGRAAGPSDPPFLMIQDWDFNGYGAPVELIAQLFEEIPQFRSLKVEVVPAGVKYTEVLEATEGQLHVAGGWAVGQMIEGLDRGVHAFMPTGMHEIYCEIYRRYSAGDRARAEALFRELLPVLAFANQHLDISIHFFKRLLYREGVFPTPAVREPTVPFDEVHESIGEELVELAIRLTREVAEAP